MRRTEQGGRGTGTVSALRNVLLGSAAALALLTNAAVLGSANAQAIPSQQGASQAIAFNIPAQDLGGALNTFADRAGLRLLFPSNLVAGRRSAGLAGTLTRNQALTRLLAGSGLTYRFTSANTVTIADPAPTPVGAAPAGAIALDTIDVDGVPSSDPGRTEGTGSYTPSVTATATRFQLTPRETPQSISVITQQQMNDFSLRSINDVVNQTPGLSTEQAGSGITNYYARGFNVQSMQFDGMQTYLNGAYPGTDTSRDMAMYDRVEVLKGTSGLTTGAGNPGATINLIRKKPTRAFQGYTTLRAGSWDDYRGELDLSGALNESGTVRGRFVTAHQDSRSYLSHREHKSSLFYGIIEADLTPDTLLTVGADYQRYVPRGYTAGMIPLFNSLGEFNTVPRSFNPGARWGTWEQNASNVFTMLEHRFDNEWRIKLHLLRQVSGYDMAVASASGGNPNPLDGSGVSLWRYNYTGKTRNDTAELFAAGPLWLFDRKHELVVGGRISRRDWRNNNFDVDPTGPGTSNIVSDFYNWTGNIPQPRLLPDPTYSNREVHNESGVYAATRLNVHDRLKVLLGARIADYEANLFNWGNRDRLKKSGQVIPYYGAVLDLTDALSAYASYTGIFMPQTAQNEQGATLPPLEGINTEFGLKAAFFDGRLNASAAYFQLKQDNYAVPSGGLTPTGTPAYRPADGVMTEGFELEISGQLSPQWQIQTGFTHNVSQLDNVRVVTLIPANQFTFYSTYKLDGALDGLTLGGGARWMDKTWENVRNPVHGTVLHTAPSYWVVDAMASYKFNDNLLGTLNIRNLLDNKYYTFYNWYNGYAWGAPRSVLLTMTYKF
ncbi:TonB-dependent siderophore receptor [Nitrobacter winogradskyi Nb-255]|uniref:TonB-dependent siderophore receptor n=1 Tax=Nitrobacter winogradskyi (strain ATCC 25391 / DSM 10237 / CIP 104748 / NCIMB 11846 / Nb-255) TaxID=323098 RepID=Q3SQY4_NITWN|nr:TonB-dependent siderophore receptor [Nitrobacter winogradskyi]ABA05307.1 TonB-dependent siderophore receptor [Nitrobacter winogradskyi Nb-255]